MPNLAFNTPGGRIVARDLLRAQQPVAPRTGVEVLRRGRRRTTGPLARVEASARQRDAVDRHLAQSSKIVRHWVLVSNVDGTLEVGEADLQGFLPLLLCLRPEPRRLVGRTVPLVARVVRAGGPGKFPNCNFVAKILSFDPFCLGLSPAADRESAARRISLHELVDELAEGLADHALVGVYLSCKCILALISSKLDGHRAVVAFLLPAPEELEGAAAAFVGQPVEHGQGLVDDAAGRAAGGGPGLLRDHAHDHSHRLLLHWDHPHSSLRHRLRKRHGCPNSDQRRPTGRPTDALARRITKALAPLPFCPSRGSI